MNEIKRPVTIKIYCIISAILLSLNLISITISFFYLSRSRSLYILFNSVIGIAALLGLWKMRRWGVYLYLGFYIINTSIFYLIPPPNAEMLNKPLLIFIVPLIYCAVVLPHWKKLI